MAAGVRHRRKSPENSRLGALAYEQVLRQRLARNEPLSGKRPQRKLREFSAEWLEVYARVNNKPSEYKSKEKSLRKHLLPFFGDVPLEAIHETLIAQYKNHKQKESLAPKTINIHLTVLKRLLATAQEWGFIDRIPRIQLLRVPIPRFDFLTPVESKLLLAAAEREPLYHAMVLCALRTGLRFGEIIGLPWRDVDLEKEQLTVSQSLVEGNLGSPKNNRVRTVPLTPDLKACLSLLRCGEPTGFVFCRENGEPLTSGRARQALIRILKRAGLRHIGWHALRHTFASQLAGANVPIGIVQQLLGHSTVEMTMRYAHSTPSAVRDAVCVLPLLEKQADDSRHSAVNTTRTTVTTSGADEGVDLRPSLNQATIPDHFRNSCLVDRKGIEARDPWRQMTIDEQVLLLSGAEK